MTEKDRLVEKVEKMYETGEISDNLFIVLHGLALMSRHIMN